MEIREFNKKQLREFIDSGEYKTYNLLPITPMRVNFQEKNPWAGEEDILLLLALNDKKEITGYCGLLPGRITAGINEKMWWNTCWWVDPVKGRGVAMQLFFRMLKITGKKMAFAELTPHTRKIIEHFDDFVFPELPIGFRGFMRLQISALLPPKSSFFKKILFLLKADDAVRNVLFGWLFFAKRIKKIPVNTRIEECGSVDETAAAFIAGMDKHLLFNRTADEINLILEFPWLAARSKSNKSEFTGYYFSALVKHFRMHLYKIYEGERLCGVCLLSNRDGFIKVPYIAFEKDDARFVTKALYYLLSRQKHAHTFTTFNPLLIKEIRRGRTPFVFKRRIRRNFAINTAFSTLDFTKVLVPDGAGDGIFT